MNTTEVIHYLSTAFQYTFEVLVLHWNFSSLLLSLTIVQREMLYVLYYIYLTALVTVQMYGGFQQKM